MRWGNSWPNKVKIQKKKAFLGFLLFVICICVDFSYNIVLKKWEVEALKRLICIILLCLTTLTLASCAEADAIKNGIKEKLPKPEEYEVIEAIVEKPNVELEKNMTFLVVQEIEGDRLLCAVDETETLYSVPNWFGDTEIKPGTYILVKHADNSLQTSPLQFGFIYSMNYYTETGSVIEGVKPQ